MAETRHNDASRAAEMAARTSYGRLLAYLARAFRDVAAAEDALGEAFARALEVWPLQGAPANPEAWLLVASRNRLFDQAKARKVRLDAVETILAVSDRFAPGTSNEETAAIPDKRLELMFVCAHPAIDRAVRTPLMLQTVLGLDAARIASSFLVSPAAMGQRLSRAKARIAAAGIRFAIPDENELASRVGDVREAIYAAYGAGWDSQASPDSPRKGLATEAIWLARVLCEVRREDAESLGLLSLMLFCESRRAARLVEGRYIPLREQDPALWERTMLHEAETLLFAASGLATPGRFQIEAAVQSANVQGVVTKASMAGPLLSLHRSLAAFAPTFGNRVGLAAAIAEAEGPHAGLAALSEMDPAKARGYQPYWALRGHLLIETKSAPAAIDEAFGNAIGLCDDASVRAYLQRRWMAER